MGGFQGLKDMVEGTEVSGFDDFGLAVNALTVAEVVVGAAFDELAGEAGHENVRSYKPAPAHFEEARKIIGERSWVHVAASWYHDIEPVVRLGRVGEMALRGWAGVIGKG